MQHVPIALISPKHMPSPERSALGRLVYSAFENWLDAHYGRLMGLSMSGIESEVVAINYEDFLYRCEDKHIRPSEAAFDHFAALSESAFAAD